MATRRRRRRLAATSHWPERPLPQLQQQGGRGELRGDKCPRQPSNSDDGSTKCPVHNSTRHTASECREIKKLTEQFHKKMQQQRQDGAPSRQREGKQKVDSQEEKDAEMEF
jgi:hypothetical protein